MGVQFAEPTVSQYGKALYDFDAEEDVELSLKKSDLVKIISLDGEWCYGELNGVKGYFPHNFVKDIDEEEYNRLLKKKLSSTNGESSDSYDDATKEESMDLNENENNTKEESTDFNENENNTKEESTDLNENETKEDEKVGDNRLKLLEKQIRNSTLWEGGSHRASTDGKRSWFSAYQGSVRYVSKNASIIAMKENGPNPERNSLDKLHSKYTSALLSPPTHQDVVKAKSDSNLLGNIKDNQLKPKQPEPNDFGFINGPAKLKMKWIEFIGGQEVADSMGLTKKDIKRQEVIYEMIDTEKDYVNDLSIIIEVFIYIV